MKNLELEIDIDAEYRKRFLFYKPYRQQLAFHNAGKYAPERLFIAGNRTGKTFCGSLEVAIHATGRYPAWWDGARFDFPTTIWVASENYEITRNVLQKYLLGNDGEEGLISSKLIIKKNKATGIKDAIDFVSIRHITGGVSTIYFKSYKQGRDKFQSARCHVIHLDEEPPKDIYTECCMRLADVDGKGQGVMILTMTPLKGVTEMTTHFMLRATNDNTSDDVYKVDAETVNNGRWYVNATWDDNPYLSEETKAQYRATLKPHEIEARERGIPCIGSGLVYQVPESEFVVEPFDIPKHWSCIAGMDVGFHAPTAVVFLAHDRDTDTVYLYKDYSVNQQLPAQHATSLVMMGMDWIPAYCDPAANQGSQFDGSKLIDHYNATGMKVIKAKQTKELSITEVLNRIRTDRFKVFRSCHKFMQEWRSYSRDDKGTIIKGNDHLMNALEFVILNLGAAKTKLEHEMKYQYGQKTWRF